MIRFESHNDLIGFCQTGNTGCYVDGISKDSMGSLLKIYFLRHHQARIDSRMHIEWPADGLR